MAIADLADLQFRLKQRGFKQDDALLHECPNCQERALARYLIAGRGGGRDITLCLACGKSRSWRSGAGLEQRTEDLTFDLRAFLA